MMSDKISHFQTGYPRVRRSKKGVKNGPFFTPRETRPGAEGAGGGKTFYTHRIFTKKSTEMPQVSRFNRSGISP